MDLLLTIVQIIVLGSIMFDMSLLAGRAAGVNDALKELANQMRCMRRDLEMIRNSINRLKEDKD